MDKTIKELISQGSEIQHKDPKEAMDLFKQAISQMSNKEEYDSYEYLFSHALIMRLSEQIGEEYNSQAKEYAYKCMDILQPLINAGNIWHFAIPCKIQMSS